jgi:hypothetical protein
MTRSTRQRERDTETEEEEEEGVERDEDGMSQRAE